MKNIELADMEASALISCLIIFMALFRAEILFGALAPGTYARDYYSRDKGVLSYVYGGKKLIEVTASGSGGLMHRSISDGCLMTTPLFQQIYLGSTNESPMEVEIVFHLSEDALCMRPRRAFAGEAVLGQVGRPLIHGVNGLYDIMDDLLLDWSENDWQWIGDELEQDESGNSLKAGIRVRLGKIPWIINLRPRYYREHLGWERHNPRGFRPRQEAVAGWCSWQACGRNLNIGVVSNAASFLARELLPYGLEYLQIDDGYQPLDFGIAPGKSLMECWLGSTVKFPDGICQAAELIRNHGLRPGIWMSTDLRTYMPGPKESNLVLRSSSGAVLKAPWIRHGLCGTMESLENTLCPVLREFCKSGFEYVKLDSLRHNFYDALGTAVNEGLLDTETARERFRNFFKVARDAIGEQTFFLPCWGVFAEGVGMADAMRLSIDSNPYWERLQQQQYDLCRYWPLQRILFQLDPDHVCCRASVDWARSALSTVSLCGGLMMISDSLKCYEGERLEMVRQCLPPLATMPAETGSLDLRSPAYANFCWTYEGKPLDETLSGHFDGRGDPAPFGTLWAIHCAGRAGSSCVVKRNGLWNLTGGRISLDRLGLDSESRYIAFDFWAKDYWQGGFWGLVDGGLDFSELKAGSSQTVILRPYSGRPQFLGATRHVAGGHLELLLESWDEEAQELRLKLRRQPGTYLVYVHVPEGYCKKDSNAIRAEGGIIKDTRSNDGRIVRLLVSPGKGDEVSVGIKFGCESKLKNSD